MLREREVSFAHFSKLPIDFLGKYAILVQSIGVSTGFFVVPADSVGTKHAFYHAANRGMKW